MSRTRSFFVRRQLGATSRPNGASPNMRSMTIFGSRRSTNSQTSRDTLHNRGPGTVAARIPLRARFLARDAGGGSSKRRCRLATSHPPSPAIAREFPTEIRESDARRYEWIVPESFPSRAGTLRNHDRDSRAAACRHRSTRRQTPTKQTSAARSRRSCDLFFIDAVRPRADRETDNFGMIDRIRIELTQIFGLGVGVRKRLKVDDEFVRVETFADVFDAFADLIADRIGFDRGGRPKRIVVAIGAAADGDRAIAIRTGESRIDDDFIDAFAEFFLEPAIVGTEAFGRVLVSPPPPFFLVVFVARRSL